MNKVFLLVIAILIVLLTVLILMLIHKNNKIKQLKNDMETVIQANKSLHDEIKKLTDIDKIKNDNRIEANEKIDDLHNGDAISNAIDILCNG
jgi:cell division protein FtsB